MFWLFLTSWKYRNVRNWLSYPYPCCRHSEWLKGSHEISRHLEVLILSYHFSYLSSNIDRQKQTGQWEANSFLVFNTHQVYWNVLHWAYLCSLTEKCIAPTDEVKCKFAPGSLFNMYAHCHRYDQSMLNLLLSNWSQYHEEIYTAGLDQNLLKVIRGITHRYELTFCQ